jgi:hypothetical protein
MIDEFRPQRTSLSASERQRALCATLTTWIIIVLAQGMKAQNVPFGRAISKEVLSPNGKYVVELWGLKETPETPFSASVGLTTSKRRVLVDSTVTSIENAAVSDDGRFVVLNFHVSSGGDGAAYERMKNGDYRKIVDNSYALQQVRSRRVKGLFVSDISNEQGRNTYCGLGLSRISAELFFTFNLRHLIFYSLKERRIARWQRSILQYSGWRTNRESLFMLRLDELSKRRGIALSTYETRKSGGDEFETLLSFPGAEEMAQATQTLQEFQLSTGGDDNITLLAQKIQDASEGSRARWLVTLTGTGPRFDALRGKLSLLRAEVLLETKTEGQWLTHTSFIATQE